MPSRRFFLAASAALCLVPRLAAAREFEIAVLAPRADIGDILGFREELAARGIAARYHMEVAAGPAALAAAAERIRAQRPDLVLSVFTPASQVAAGLPSDLPVVFSSVADPVGSGLVPDLTQPGGHLTGTCHIAPAPVQLHAISTYGGFRRIAALYTPCEDNARGMVAALAKAAPTLGMEVLPLPLPATADVKSCDPGAIAAQVARGKEWGADLLYLGPDTTLASNNAEAVAEAALAHSLPSFCATERPIRRARLLMGLVAPARDVGRLAALKAEEILVHRRPPGRIPVETLQRFSLLVRRDVAGLLDRPPPPGLAGIVEYL